MKKLINIFICILFCINAYSQQTNEVVVTLKNGATITGILKEFNPTSHVDIVVAGTDVHLEMKDVEKVSSATTQEKNSTQKKNSQPSRVPDLKNITKEKIVNIAGIDVKFVLIEGGTISFGYDGPNSWTWNSEPIHDVELSSFYITKDPVSIELASAILGKNITNKSPFLRFRRQKMKY